MPAGHLQSAAGAAGKFGRRGEAPATNSSAPDFRVDTIGAARQPTPLTPVGPNTWAAHVPAPASGWTAAFIELAFDVGGFPMKLTTAVRVVPGSRSRSRGAPVAR